MGRLHHLKETLPVNIRDNTRPGDPEVEFVIVNYNSPDGLEDWIKSDPEMNAWMRQGIITYAKYKDASHFRHAHAKNMAHRLASGNIVCNLDADNFTGPGFASFIAQKMSPDPHASVLHADFRFLQGISIKDAGFFGRIALSRENFMRMGGYDESFRGWGGEDNNMIVRAFSFGLKSAKIDNPAFLRIISHEHEERLQHINPAERAEGLKKIKASENIFTAQSLRQRFNDVSGWAQVNAKGFGMGTLYVGPKAREVLLLPMICKPSNRPAILGLPSYAKAYIASLK